MVFPVHLHRKNTRTAGSDLMVTVRGDGSFLYVSTAWKRTVRVWNQSSVVHLTRHGLIDTILGSRLVRSTTTAHSRVVEASHTIGCDRENRRSFFTPSASSKGHVVGSAHESHTLMRCAFAAIEKLV